MSIDQVKYWSGTNSRVVVHAVPTGDTLGITAVRVTIGGEVVFSLTLPTFPIQFYIAEAGLTVMFDSTHFGNLTELTAKFEVKTTDNVNWQSATHTKLVKNAVGLYTDPDLAHPGIDILTNAYSGMNYGVTYRHDWSTGFYFVDIRTMNALDLNVHGLNEVHYDGDDSTDTDLAEGQIWPTGAPPTESYETNLVSKIGTGLPPFNSTNWPAINFMHLNACLCGNGSAWEEILHPKKNYYSANQIENQAVLAYKCYTLDNEHDDMSEYLMEKLTAGCTVKEGAKYLVDCQEIQVRDTENGPARLLLVSDTNIYGDPYTRLTSVYTGDESSPAGWFRIAPGPPGGGL